MGAVARGPGGASKAGQGELELAAKVSWARA